MNILFNGKSNTGGLDTLGHTGTLPDIASHICTRKFVAVVTSRR